MTMKEVRDCKLAGQVVTALQSRNIDACFVRTRNEALEQALAWIPEGSKVGWGGSMSIEEIGLKQAIRSGNYLPIDRETAKSPEEADQIMHEVLSCDYFLTSSNSVSEDGILFNIDGKANRLAAICFGPKHVIMIVGINKVVKTQQDAVSRARTIAAPINAQRFELQTPCKNTGCCYDCKSPDTICCQLLTTRYSKVPGRIKVILVGENLGY